MSYPQQIYPEELRRKWFKFMAVRGQYEKSVKICKEVSVYEYYECLEPREVIAEPPLFRERMVLVKGYYRVRTEKEYYPVCGKTGIPDDGRSGLSKDFWKHRQSGHDKGQRIRFAKKLAAEEKARKAKAAEDIRTARNIPNCAIAARLGIPVAMLTDEILESKRNQIATLRAINQIKKLAI